MLCAFTVGAHGHVVQQIFLKFTVRAEAWQADVTMDAGYAWPATRDDPGAPQPSLEWLQARPPKEFEMLRRESENLIRRHLAFAAGEEPVSWHCSFPDFDTFPPDFPRLPGGFAFLTIRLNGPLPPAGSPLTLREITGSGPSFTVALGPEDFRTLDPGQALTLMGPSSRSSAQLPMLHFLIDGFRHVIPLGWDHMLFILAVFLLDRRVRPVLGQSLCFTVAHTVSLGVVMAGVWQPSPRWVEPLIALSIAAAGAGNLMGSRVLPHRLTLIFGFGLVHGLGFGGALAPVLQAVGGCGPLLAANLGVECAQAVIILVAALAFHFLPGEAVRQRTAVGINVGLVLVGLALMVSRLAGFAV